MRPKKIKPLDPSKLRTTSLKKGRRIVDLKAFARPWQPGGKFSRFLDGLPEILAGRDLRRVVEAVVQARRRGRPVILAMGAHVIKVGLSPIVIDLMKRGVVTGIALNGAGAVHDFEVAYAGKTSEDVAETLEDGSFGATYETAETLNLAAGLCLVQDVGLGQAMGKVIALAKLPHARLSILAQAVELGIPATVHVAIGTDTIHMHPSADGAAIGQGTLYDFRLFAGMVAKLEGGVYFNIGSAVILPEVFLKALSLARNLGHKVRNFTTVNLDFIQHYRPRQNVTGRPVQKAGQGISLTGHHELLLPLLAAAILESLNQTKRKKTK
jgi:hypothetical protein